MMPTRQSNVCSGIDRRGDTGSNYRTASDNRANARRCTARTRIGWLAEPCIAATLLAMATVGPAAAQSTYLPLEIGNSWTYYSLVETAPGGQFDTVGVHTVTLEETVSRGSETYFVLDHPEAFTDTVRVDAQGRVFGWIHGEDRLYFDVTAEDSATYAFVDRQGEEYEVVVRRNQVREMAAGTFANCIFFHFRHTSAVDADRGFYLAPGVGIVQTFGGMGEPTWLRSAVIGGSPLSVVRRPGLAELSARVFPSPTSGPLTVAFTLPQPSDVRISILDALGRRVANIAGGQFAGGPHEISFPAQRLAAGVYFVVLTSPTHRAVRSVILTH